MSFFVQESTDDKGRSKFIKVDDIRSHLATDNGAKFILDVVPNDDYPEPIPWFWDKQHHSWWPNFPHLRFRTSVPQVAPIVTIGSKRKCPWLDY